MKLKSLFKKQKNMKSISRIINPYVKRHHYLDLETLEFYYYHKNNEQPKAIAAKLGAPHPCPLQLRDRFRLTECFLR